MLRDGAPPGLAFGGAEVVRWMASHDLEGSPSMSKPHHSSKARQKSKTAKESAAAAKPHWAKVSRRHAPATRPTPAASRPTSRNGTKAARIVEMLRAPAGATIAGMMSATGWQSHSVRGFLAGSVRKRLKLNLISEPSDEGRIYRAKERRARTAEKESIGTA